MFKKREWSKWEHVCFVEDFRAGIKTYELLRRVDQKSGLKGKLFNNTNMMYYDEYIKNQ